MYERMLKHPDLMSSSQGHRQRPCWLPHASQASQAKREAAGTSVKGLFMEFWEGKK